MGTVRPHDDGELKWERDDGIGRAVGIIGKNLETILQSLI